jgi:hypothetical protein
VQEVLTTVNVALGAIIYPALTGICVCYAVLMAAHYPPLLTARDQTVIASAAAISFAWLSLVAAQKVPIPTLYSQLFARTVWLVALVTLIIGVVRLIRTRYRARRAERHEEQQG